MVLSLGSFPQVEQGSHRDQVRGGLGAAEDNRARHDQEKLDLSTSQLLSTIHGTEYSKQAAHSCTLHRSNAQYYSPHRPGSHLDQLYAGKKKKVVILYW